MSVRHAYSYVVYWRRGKDGKVDQFHGCTTELQAIAVCYEKYKSCATAWVFKNDNCHPDKTAVICVMGEQ